MKSKGIIGLIIMCLLAIAATAQETKGVQARSGAIVSLPPQPSDGIARPRTLQPPAGAQDFGTYPEQLESVLNTMSAELTEIAQAVREGKISRAQGEYLSMERYYASIYLELIVCRGLCDLFRNRFARCW